jgi:hypothetical protein
MAAASKPPNEPASAAAEKKRAARKPSSWRLYQQLNENQHCDPSNLATNNLRKVVINTGEQASLGNSEKESGREQTLFVLDHTHEGHDGTPSKDDGGEEDTRGKPLDGNVGERLEASVRDEEDGQGIEIVARLHVKSRLNFCDTSITDICAVQEGEEIQQRQPRN